jgi:hypothetical protein
MNVYVDPNEIPRAEHKVWNTLNNNYYSTTSKNKSNFTKELEVYNLPDCIIKKANEIHNQMKNQIRRNTKRTQLKFYCVYNAYIELGRSIDPFNLGRTFKLKNSDVRKTDSLFSEVRTGYQPPKKITSPLDLLETSGAKIGLSKESITDLVSDSKSILNKNSSLNQETPQTVAAGLLQYYINNNGIKLEDPLLMNEAINRSSVTTDNMAKLIAEIDNSSFTI